MEEAMAGMGGAGGAGGDEFAQIRELLQNNPQMLPVLLNQLAQSQPEVRLSKFGHFWCTQRKRKTEQVLTPRASCTFRS